MSCKSFKKEIVVNSTIEDEYSAVSEVRVVPSIIDLTIVYCDNNRTIAQTKEPRYSKHVLRWVHLIRDFRCLFC